MSFRYYDPVQVGGMLVYEGSRRQRGGNLLGALKRIVLPMGKNLARRAAGGLVRTGKDLARRGVKVGVGAVADRLRGGPGTSLKSSLKQRAAAAANKAVVDYFGDDDQPDIPFLSQDGFGLRRRKKRKGAKRCGGPAAKRRKTINRRKAPAKRRTKRRKPAKKRRRTTDIFS